MSRFLTFALRSKRIRQVLQLLAVQRWKLKSYQNRSSFEKAYVSSGKIEWEKLDLIYSLGLQISLYVFLVVIRLLRDYVIDLWFDSKLFPSLIHLCYHHVPFCFYSVPTSCVLANGIHRVYAWRDSMHLSALVNHRLWSTMINGGNSTIGALHVMDGFYVPHSEYTV